MYDLLKCQKTEIMKLMRETEQKIIDLYKTVVNPEVKTIDVLNLCMEIILSTNDVNTIAEAKTYCKRYYSLEGQFDTVIWMICKTLNKSP